MHAACLSARNRPHPPDSRPSRVAAPSAGRRPGVWQTFPHRIPSSGAARLAAWTSASRDEESDALGISVAARFCRLVAHAPRAGSRCTWLTQVSLRGSRARKSTGSFLTGRHRRMCMPFPRRAMESVARRSIFHLAHPRSRTPDRSCVVLFPASRCGYRKCMDATSSAPMP